MNHWELKLEEGGIKKFFHHIHLCQRQRKRCGVWKVLATPLQIWQRQQVKNILYIFYEMVLSINNSFGPTAREQIKCPMGNYSWRIPSQKWAGPSFSHRVIWSRRRVLGERMVSRGGVTESMVLCCCLSACWPVTTRGISHVLSVAGRWVEASALLPSETEESGCKPCELTQQQIFIRVWVERECMCVLVGSERT